jgi:RimJ/RimL family protein N-acetyltransferase
MLNIGFEIFHFHRIYARCDPRNTGSWKVMERLGMRKEAHLIHNEIFKGEWGDELIYAILENEWRTKNGRNQ